jgi:MerR family transcriptional regulator, thiopeptide resistance regulator
VVAVDDDAYPVGAVARLAGISVRSLHHYHQIGLLSPSGRSAAGYRIYSLGDLKRLQQILFYRALGFPLGEIAQILADPAQDAHAHLRRQHRLLREQITRRQDMLAAIEKELEAGQMGIALTPEEQLEIFGTTKVTGEWADEAQRRPRATDLAERHRQHISRWFYDCTYDMHRGLAEMYLADERFTRTYDDLAPGLARYVHDAMLANADRGAGG